MQLAQIAGKVVAVQKSAQRRRDGLDDAMPLSNLGQRVVDVAIEVFAALTQWRQVNADAEAEIQVAAKAPFFHGTAQVTVRRRDDAHVDRARLVAAQARNLSIFQNPQQIGLQIERQLAQLIQKQRAAVCLLELPGLPAAARTRERPLDVAKQLAREQLPRMAPQFRR